MRKVIFADRTFVIIEDSQEAGVERKMNGTAKFRLNHLSGSDLIDPREIRRVTDAKAGEDYTPKVNLIEEKFRISAKRELTDEEREANLVKLAEIKANFLKKKAEREK